MSEIDQGGVGEDGAEARDADVPGASGFPEIAKIVVSVDGALHPMRAESLALAHGDGYSGQEAWDVSGGGALSYRRRIEKSPVFKERVVVLVSEREKLEALGIAGEVVWAAKQNWRIARAGGVVTEIHRATVLYVDTVRALLGAPAADQVGGAAPSAEPSDAPRGPGRPPNQPRQLRVDVLQMREKLTGMGVRVDPVQ